MKSGKKRRLRISAALLAVYISAGLSACGSKQQPPDMVLDNIPITDNTAASQRVIINFAKPEYREYGTFNHAITFTLTNQTDYGITGYELGVLAFDGNGSPMDIYWIGMDSSVPRSYLHEYRTEKEELTARGGTESSSWTLESMRGEEENARYDEIEYVLYDFKEITFGDGTIWENPGYGRWLDTYKGKTADTDILKGYYPLEVEISGME